MVAVNSWCGHGSTGRRQCIFRFYFGVFVVIVYGQWRPRAQQTPAIGARVPQEKFGTIDRFYSGISVANTTDINRFSCIKELRRALSALDRGGWERSYHQKLFHVSLSPCGRLRRVLVWLGDSDMVACIKWNVATVHRNRFWIRWSGWCSRWTHLAFSKSHIRGCHIRGNEQLVDHQPRNIVRFEAVFRTQRCLRKLFWRKVRAGSRRLTDLANPSPCVCLSQLWFLHVPTSRSPSTAHVSTALCHYAGATVFRQGVQSPCLGFRV